MAAGYIIQPAFNAGEWSPRMYGRTDIDRYKYAVKTMRNFLPLPSGPARRRSGTRYVDTLPSDGVLVRFERDSLNNYMLAWYVDKCRVYKNEGVVVAPTHTFAPGDIAGNQKVQCY